MTSICQIIVDLLEFKTFNSHHLKDCFAAKSGFLVRMCNILHQSDVVQYIGMFKKSGKVTGMPWINKETNDTFSDLITPNLSDTKRSKKFWTLTFCDSQKPLQHIFLLSISRDHSKWRKPLDLRFKPICLSLWPKKPNLLWTVVTLWY